MEILGVGIQGVKGDLTKDLTNLTFNPPFIVGIPLSKSNPVLRINWTLSQIMVTRQPGHLARMTLPNWAYKFRKSFVLLTLTP
jgi:hypothetical protein